MRLLNVLNACFLATGAVLMFILESLDLIRVLAAIYVIAFSLLLLCFETHIHRFELAVHRNFGFMFSWQGRALFFFFVGTLSFGLGVVGIAAGIFTVCNLIFNVYTMATNRQYHEHLQNQGLEMRTRARQQDLTASGLASAAAPSSAPGSGLNASDPQIANSGPSMPVTVATALGDVTVNVGVGAPNNLDSDPAWKKYTDEGTGSPYWYNEVTKETRWS